MPKNDYWAEREEKWITQQIKDDALVTKKIELEFNRALVDINKDITAFYTNYAKSQNISMAEAMARVSAFDVKGFESTAKQMVADKDFSPNANERLKLYNATMRINRLEYLKSQIGVELAKSNSKLEKLMSEKLTSAYQKRVERQFGILSEQELKDVLKSAQTIVNADFQGATWSDRIWANNDTLKSRLEQLLTRSLVQGINPNVLARNLRDQFKKEFDNARYMAERLMRTETARVQDAAQMKSFEKYGYKYVKWIAEPSACNICLGIATDNDGVYLVDEVPTIPVHANCRCSKAAYVPDSNKLSFDEEKALKDYISSDSYKLNDLLRREDTLTGRYESMVNTLDSVLDKLPSYNSAKPLYRSLSFGNREETFQFSEHIIKNGGYIDRGYISTSREIYDSDDSVRIVITKSHSGANLKGFNDAEKEVLFKRGTKFVLKDFYLDSSGKPIIEVTERD